jgi:hypothetical protein
LNSAHEAKKKETAELAKAKAEIVSLNAQLDSANEAEKKATADLESKRKEIEALTAKHAQEVEESAKIRRKSAEDAKEASLVLEAQLTQMCLRSFRTLEQPADGCVTSRSIVSRLTVEDPRFKILRDSFLQSIRSHRKNYRSDEWCELAQLEIDSIDLVENPHLTQKFLTRRRELVQALSPHEPTDLKIDALLLDGSLRDYLLYHGAEGSIVERICTKGFDPQRGGENAGKMFGVGAYFAENASKADFYAIPDPDRSPQGQRATLVTRVLLGDAFRASKETIEKLPERTLNNYTHAPRKPGSIDHYDSVCGLRRNENGLVDHREYVVYKDDQALPLAVIRYRHLKQCKCNNCCYLKNT